MQKVWQAMAQRSEQAELRLQLVDGVYVLRNAIPTEGPRLAAPSARDAGSAWKPAEDLTLLVVGAAPGSRSWVQRRSGASDPVVRDSLPCVVFTPEIAHFL
eukprot:GHVT01053624.1.p3 GENE.GHVT01053624.1~~GHVT01053624.1.p3  ORF type:complete len:101 (-),score=13.82 GHVT01053624.1:317-619(-)